MPSYNVPTEFDVKDYPFELRNQVARFLNTHQGKYTIPQIAAELCAEEMKVAWVLTNLCELTTPEVVLDSDDGRGYYERVFRLKAKSPKGFSEKSIFLGRAWR